MTLPPAGTLTHLHLSPSAHGPNFSGEPKILIPDWTVPLIVQLSPIASTADPNPPRFNRLMHNLDKRILLKGKATTILAVIFRVTIA